MQIESYRSQIDRALSDFIQEMGEKNRLRDACEYALLNGGKRLRPILVLMIAEELQKGLSVLDAALSVEFFHTASLIADDLPCMDNDSMRRDKPSLHVVFGEDIAVLSSYALIAAGYGGIYRNGINLPRASLLCLEAAQRCAGIQGATNGQFLDLYPPDYSQDTLQKILYQKTGTLFEIAFTFGWLFGGGEEEKLGSVQTCAYHLGMAFQLADDLLDSEDQKQSLNSAHILGKDEARKLFEKELKLFEGSLKGLGLWSSSFQEVHSWLENYSLKGCLPK